MFPCALDQARAQLEVSSAGRRRRFPGEAVPRPPGSRRGFQLVDARVGAPEVRRKGPRVSAPTCTGSSVRRAAPPARRLHAAHQSGLRCSAAPGRRRRCLGGASRCRLVRGCGVGFAVCGPERLVAECERRPRLPGLRRSLAPLPSPNVERGPRTRAPVTQSPPRVLLAPAAWERSKATIPYTFSWE